MRFLRVKLRLKQRVKCYKIFPLDFPLRLTVSINTEPAMLRRCSNNNQKEPTPLSTCSFVTLICHERDTTMEWSIFTN